MKLIRHTLFFILPLMPLFFSSCKSENESQSIQTKKDNASATIADLVQHFKDNGINGQYSTKPAGMIGASSAGQYAEEGVFSIQIAKFDSPQKAKDYTESANLESKKLSTYSNGNFILYVSSGGNDVAEVFNNF